MNKYTALVPPFTLYVISCFNLKVFGLVFVGVSPVL
jgi:hypothetical protein